MERFLLNVQIMSFSVGQTHGHCQNLWRKSSMARKLVYAKEGTKYLLER